MTIRNPLMLKAVTGIATLMVLAAPHVGAAQDGADDGEHLTVGVGGYGVSSPYDKDGEEKGVFPFFAFRNSWLSIDPGGVAVKAASLRSCKLEVLAAPRFLMAEPGDVERYADIDRDIGLDVGGRAGCAMGSGFGASVTYKADVLDESNGHEVDVAISKNFSLTDRIGIDLKAGTYWRDDDLSQYLYGVYADEARPGRPAYAPGDTFVPYANLGITLGITDHVMAAATFETEIYTREIKASPIIAREAIGTGTLSLLYTF